MSNTFNQDMWRSQIAYQRELSGGRLSSWARAEGRSERLVRRARRRLQRDRADG
jgi:hypothetical protein